MLLSERRFLPFFLTQGLGAFNDNLFKNLLVLLFTYQASQFPSPFQLGTVTNLAAGLFILPFACFSGIGGYMADTMSKSALIRILKIVELVVMCLAGFGLITHSFWVLMACIFLMGAQSAFFGPVKYAYLPAVLDQTEIMSGNAIVESVTFLVILAGTLSAGILIEINAPISLIIALPILTALAGLATSWAIPALEGNHQRLQLQFNTLWRSNFTAFQHTRAVRSVWLSVLGISWFWFIGAMLLAQLPELASSYLKLDAGGLTWLLALFAIGVGAGSVLSERLSGKQVEIGLVPLGSIGISVFLYLAFHTLPLSQEQGTPLAFMHNTAAIHFGIHLALAGLFGGLYTVPLYALIQTRSNPAHVASVISANNVLNAAFMVGAALIGIVLSKLGVPTPWMVCFAALFNVLVAVYIYGLVPEFLWRFIVWMLVHTVYRFRVQGMENVPAEGPCIVVCNHIGFSDAVVLGAAFRRPLRFIMYYKIFQSKALGWFFKTAKAIPIAGKREDPDIFESSFKRIKQALDEGEIVCIFPEGKLTADGEVDVFKPGLLRVLETSPVPVIPMALSGLWGSVFTRKKGGKAHRELGRPIDLTIGKPVPAAEVNMEDLRAQVIALRNRP